MKINKKGFTLAELLIVMAIVVVLAAVAVPTFGRQVETSRETADLQVIRNCYEEALTVAMRDSLDGKLDGYVNKANPSDTGTDIKTLFPYITTVTPSSSDNSCAYEVTLASLDSKPKFSQNASDTAWKFVDNKIVNAGTAKTVAQTDDSGYTEDGGSTTQAYTDAVAAAANAAKSIDAPLVNTSKTKLTFTFQILAGDLALTKIEAS